MANVLIVDDDPQICRLLSKKVVSLGHTAETSATLLDGEEKAATNPFDIVFLDINLPDGNGLDALPRIQRSISSPEVVIMTGLNDAGAAEVAVRNGAWDYLKKPFSSGEIQLQLARALQYRKEKRVPKTGLSLKREGLVGNSARMRDCLYTMAQAAQSNANVLIKGETGTGKEVFARAIHENSLREGRPFVVVDCAVLPENLVESVLFGHEKGAFTGADRVHGGLIKQADGGTLFLDEIGELPLSMQKAFLRVIQEHRFRSVGGSQEIESDFRLVAATNRNLEDFVKAGRFRQDLLFRLQTFVLELPPLREHKEDIKDIVLHHVTNLCLQAGLEPKGFSPEFFDTLMAYDWPGNIRELIHTLERAVALEPLNPILYPKHLSDSIRAKVIRESLRKRNLATVGPISSDGLSPQLPTLKEARERAMTDLERQYLQNLMSSTKGDIKESCRISGLGRTRLYDLLKKYNISKP